MIFGIDFDGTCVTNAFPKAGEDIGAEIVIRELLNSGHQVFIWTMRSSTSKDYRGNSLSIDVLQPVKDWLIKHGLTEVKINENPEGQDWTTSPKQFAHYYIDDMALGTPLMYFKGQNVVNWTAITRLLHLANVFSYKQMVELIHKLPYGQ